MLSEETIKLFLICRAAECRILSTVETDFSNHLGTSKFVRIILDCKAVRIFRIQVRASSQTKCPGEADGRVRLSRFARVRLLRYALNRFCETNRLFCGLELF